MCLILIWYRYFVMTYHYTLYSTDIPFYWYDDILWSIVDMMIPLFHIRYLFDAEIVLSNVVYLVSTIDDSCWWRYTDSVPDIHAISTESLPRREKTEMARRNGAMSGAAEMAILNDMSAGIGVAICQRKSSAILLWYWLISLKYIVNVY